jgi:hypothetical protein
MRGTAGRDMGGTAGGGQGDWSLRRRELQGKVLPFLLLASVVRSVSRPFFSVASQSLFRPFLLVEQESRRARKVVRLPGSVPAAVGR